MLYDFIIRFITMKDIFLSGIQWSWKGTQADLLMEKFPNKFKYFETWGILRTLAWTDNAIWNYLKDTIESWWLIKDEIVVAIFDVFLKTIEKGDCLLMDWVLRKLWQTRAICEKLKEVGRDFVVLHFDLPDEIVYERLASRIICSKCGNNAKWWDITWVCDKCGWMLVHREDDLNILAVKKRIESFHKETEPCLRWLEDRGWLVLIDANRWVDEIFEDVLKYVK